MFMASLKPKGFAENKEGGVIPSPSSVAIVAMGLSSQSYIISAAGQGTRRIFDEVWGINVMGDLLQCDRVFLMDHIQNFKTDGNIPEHLQHGYDDFLRRCRVPVYTSEANSDYPCTVDFPLEEVINDLKFSYLNNTVAYAIGYAIYLGVKDLYLFGCDYNYNNGIDGCEPGRACVEFLLGIAASRGIKLHVAESSSLLDTDLANTLYGYPYEVSVSVDPSDATRYKVVKHKDKPRQWSKTR
jgi:hypothetical protein